MRTKSSLCRRLSMAVSFSTIALYINLYTCKTCSFSFIRLSDKVCSDAHWLLFRQYVAFAFCTYGTYEKSNIATKNAHNLHSFFILYYLFGCIAMYLIPIPA